MRSFSIISPEEIFNSYNKYGEDFLVIDINNYKESTMKTVKYFDIKIKTEDGSLIIPKIRFAKLLLASKIKPPTERDYEKLKIAIRRDDEVNTKSLFGKSIELICNVFTKKVKDMKAEGIINDDEDDDNNTPNVVIVPSCKPQTPLQKKAKAKDKDGVSKSFDNPMLWFGLNYKKEDEASLTTLDFSYKIDDKTKFKIKHFDVNIYNNKHVVNREPQLATVNNELINNFNIDKFLTIKSELYGFVYMQVKASKQSFNLNTKLYHSLYVNSNKSTGSSKHLLDEDEMNDMLKDSIGDSEYNNSYTNSSTNSIPVNVPVYDNKLKDSDEEYEDEEDGEDSINDEINNLKFT